MAKSPGSWAGRNLLLAQIDALIAVSEFTAQVLRQGHRDPQSPEAERHVRPPMRGDFSKITVIHGGIDTAKFRPMDAAKTRQELGLKPDDYAFAVVGGFDAASRERPTRISGRGWQSGLQNSPGEVSYCRSRQHGTNVETRHGPSGTRRKSVADGTGQQYAASDERAGLPLVHPQIGTEALGLVVCEAHACGKPVIASAIDGIPEAFAAGCAWGRSC